MHYWSNLVTSRWTFSKSPGEDSVGSHVIEHTPDMLGFLKEYEVLLRPEGVLVLAVPDKRRCFDLLRPVSTTGAVLQAHHEKPSRHSPATAFDHVAHISQLPMDAGGWSEATRGNLALCIPCLFARAVFYRSAVSPEYFDFHSWTFTPSSFRLIIRGLNEIDLPDLRELRFQLTPSV
jgi:hypothetical protein